MFQLKNCHPAKSKWKGLKGLVLAPKEPTSKKKKAKNQRKIVREHFQYLHKLFVLFGLGIMSKYIDLECLY